MSSANGQATPESARKATPRDKSDVLQELRHLSAGLLAAGVPEVVHSDGAGGKEDRERVPVETAETCPESANGPKVVAVERTDLPRPPDPRPEPS